MKLIFLMALTLPFATVAQDMPSCPMHDEHMAQAGSDHHHAGVDARGDHEMGFSHEKTTHHFRLFADGGAIEVTANDASDTESRDQIRAHLAHVAQLFSAGNFQIPMLVHDQIPPGVPVMKDRKNRIHYTYESSETGGSVRITTKDEKALAAVHEFLRFQITDHRTGDPLTVGSAKQ
jgi:hypothetical protein